MTALHSALEGVTVLDFSWVGAGPFATKFLADFGATVIKVESRKRLDIGRMAPPFANKVRHLDGSALFLHTNTSKLGITLNLQHQKALPIAKRLAGMADVVVENFTPGVVGRLGLGYETLREIKPDIIMASLSIYGQTGPKSRFSGFGNAGAAISGHYMLTGWPDRDPVSPGMAYADIVQPIFATVAILSALEHRRRTGKGQYIDVTQAETMIQFLAPAFVEYFANGKVPQRQGNRSSYACPHGVFPCRGEDQWIALAVTTDEEWESLQRAMGNPDWSRFESFASLASRKTNEDQLESQIAEWTRNFDRADLATLLNNMGVPAGPVQDGSDLVDQDPQLRDRGSFVQLEHPVMGKCNHPVPPVKLPDCPARVKTAPCLGEHNDYVYLDLLKMGEKEYQGLKTEGVMD